MAFANTGRWLTGVLSARREGAILTLALAACAALTLAGCSLFSPEKTVIPPKVAKALDLAPEADGPNKGLVVATPERAAAIHADYDAKLAADEAKAKAERDAKIQAAKDAADAAVQQATTQVAKTKKLQARALQQVLDAQSDELDAIAENAANTLLTQLNAQKLAASKAEAALAAVAAERDAAARAFAAADADQKAREEKRVGGLNAGLGIATAAAQTAGGPWGALAVGGLGLVAGWLGLSKPGDKAAAEKATALSGTVTTLVKAVDILPPEIKNAVQQTVASISTPQDELHITEAKAALRT